MLDHTDSLGWHHRRLAEPPVDVVVGFDRASRDLGATPQSTAWALTMFSFCSLMHHGDGASFRSAVLGRSLGRQRQHIEELVALTGDYGVVRAAYDEAIKRRPGRTVTLRQKTRVLADSRRER